MNYLSTNFIVKKRFVDHKQLGEISHPANDA